MFCRVCVFWVRVWDSYRTYRSSGYGYGSHTELTEVPGRYTNVVPVPVPAPGYFYKGIPVLRVLCHGRTELTEVLRMMLVQERMRMLHETPKEKKHTINTAVLIFYMHKHVTF
ncbi:unnamed protein product [Laminaria digitata]